MRFNRKVLVLILAVALLVRIGIAVAWQARINANALNSAGAFQFGDSAGYWCLAERIANGESYDYNSKFAKVFRAPGYPAVLAPLFLIWDEPPVIAARILGALLGTISIFLVYLIAAHLFTPTVGILAALLLSFYPGAIAISILVLAEVLFVPLMLLQCWMMIVAFQVSCRKQLVFYSSIAGVCYGLAVLTRPSWLLFLPFAFPIGLILYSQRKRWAAVAGIGFVCCLLTMSPWWIRNYAVTGKFVPTTLQTGPSLYDGWNEHATGASDMSWIPDLRRKALEDWKSENKPDREFEYAFNQQMIRMSMEWASQNPDRVAVLAIRKFWRTWSPVPNTSELRSFWVRAAVATYFCPLFLLSVVGAIRYRQDQIIAMICVVPVCYFTLLHMVFVGSIRYRHPPMFLFAILAAVTLLHLLRRESEIHPRNKTENSVSTDRC